MPTANKSTDCRRMRLTALLRLAPRAMRRTCSHKALVKLETLWPPREGFTRNSCQPSRSSPALGPRRPSAFPPSFSTSSWRPPFREFVIFGAPIVLRGSPVRFDPAAALQTVQCGIQRALLHAKDVARSLLDSLGNSQAMLWFERHGPQKSANPVFLAANRCVRRPCTPLLLLQGHATTLVEAQGTIRAPSWHTRSISPE